MPHASAAIHTPASIHQAEASMRRTRFLQSLIAAAALAAPALSLPASAAAGPRYAVTVVAGAGIQANDLNNAGQVVGWLQAGDAYHGFVYSSGLLTDIGTLGGRDSVATAINDLGQVVGNSSIDANGGSYGFLYSGGSMSALGGGTYMQAYGINNGGAIVGAAASTIHGTPNSPDDPFVWHEGTMTGLGNLGRPWGAALSINDFAFLYENGEMIDLNTLIDPASGWTIMGANAINDVQQIAANACRAGVCQAVRLDLVSAVSEPPVFALLAAGLALGLARGKGFRLPVRHRRG
jgi:probable HAF family extracellular repeat protein